MLRIAEKKIKGLTLFDPGKEQLFPYQSRDGMSGQVFRGCV